MKKLIITVLGQDRPGILAAVSQVLKDNECNIENISQTILQSVFGSLLLVAAPDNIEPEDLRNRMVRALADMSLDIFVKKYAIPAHDTSGNPITHPFIISAFGPDQPGLVGALSRQLADHAINISNLKAVFKGGEDPGDNIMIFEVDIPDNVDLQELQTDLDRIAGELSLNINIQHRGIFDAMHRI